MSTPLRARALAITAGIAGVALLAAACSSSSSSGSTSGASVSVSPGCEPYAAYMGHSGTTVTMFASILSPESDHLQTSWADFEKCTGIKISYQGDNNFESQLPVRVTGGNAPDIAIIPQPGLLAKMVSTGKVVKAPSTTASNVDKYWNKAWKAYGTVNGTFYAAPMSANMKSFVWYSPKQFAAKGWKVPTTWADMMTLSDQIAASGAKPWCGGIASGTATGWPATDWMEEVVLREFGPDAYDKWVSHDLKFDSPDILKVMNIVGTKWMKNPAYVNGGHGDVKSIATTTFQDAGLPILQNQCAMLQQASFYGAQWPKGTDISENGTIYAFFEPPINTTYAKPVEGGGEFVTAFAGRPEVQAVQNYLSTPQWATSRVKVSTGWVSANNGVDPSLYTDPIDKLSATYLTDPNAQFRFDASDLMPAAVGSGSFWKQMTAWFAEGKSDQAVAQAIDASWPS